MVKVTPKPKKTKAKLTDALIIKDEQNGDVLAQYDEEMVQAITDTVAKGANRSELMMFLRVAQNYGLDPFRKEIWFTKIQGSPTVMTARDGYVRIAKQNPGFEKLQSNAVYENDEFNVKWVDGELDSFSHNYSNKDRGECVGAWASLKYRGLKPIFIYLQVEEYDTNKSVWKSNKTAMIRKVAEKEVCRLGEGVTGIYIEEEMPEEYSLENTLHPKKKVELNNNNIYNNSEKDIIEVNKINNNGDV